ncbi:unnamed protein product [Linum trigynum]|uniref:Uncharacterized protein n=1 Tax=Linum trigynum TaxID=586398 RepID=A0AAV2CY85_9ROSI
MYRENTTMARTKAAAAMRPVTEAETSRPKRAKQQQQEEEEESNFGDAEIEHEDDHEKFDDGQEIEHEDEDGEDEENGEHVSEEVGGRQYRFRCSTKKVLSIIKD